MEIQLPQVIFQIINFSVVMGGITYLLYRPIQKVLDERASKIEEGQKAAQDAIKEKEKIKSLKDKARRESEKEAAEVLGKARKQANKQKQEILAKAKQEATALLDKNQFNWQQEREQLFANSRLEMIEVVIEVSQRLIGKKLVTQADKKLISAELDEVISQL